MPNISQLAKPVGSFLCEWTDSLSTVYGWNLNLLQPASQAHKIGREFFGIEWPEYSDNIVYSFDIASSVISGFGLPTAAKTQWLNLPYGSHKNEKVTPGEPDRTFYINNQKKTHWTKVSTKLTTWEKMFFNVRRIFHGLFSATETIFFLMSHKAVSSELAYGIGCFNSLFGVVTSGSSCALEITFLRKAFTETVTYQTGIKKEKRKGWSGNFLPKTTVATQEEYQASKGEIILSGTKLLRSAASLVHSILCAPIVPHMPRAKLAANTVIWASEFAAFYGDNLVMGKRPEIGTAETAKST